MLCRYLCYGVGVEGVLAVVVEPLGVYYWPQVPEFDSFILTPRSQVFAIRTKGDAIHSTAMPGKAFQESS